DGYAGYVNDLALGMLETQSRIYNPSTGEFISQDPSGFSGSADGNLYEYAGNSPIDMVDPSGLSQANPLASLNFSTPVPIANTPVNFGLDANGNVPDPGISPETLALLQNAVSAAPGSTDAPASGDDASEGSEDDDVEAARASLQQEILQTGQSTAPAAQASATTSLSPLGDADIATLKEDFPMLPGEGEADYLAQYGFYRAGNPNSTDSSGGVTTEQLIQAIQDSGVQTGTRPPDPLYAIAFGSGTQNTSGYYNCVTPPAPQSSGADLFADIDLAARQTFGDSAVDFTEAAVPAAVKTTAVVVGGTVVLGGVAAFSPLIAGGAAIGGLWYWAYNVGWSAGERTADGQTATESWGGSLADNSPVGPLVKGTANVDPGTWQPLNLTPSQQGTQFGTGVGGIAGVVAAPYVYNATQSAVGSALSELTPPTFAPPLKTPEQMALDALNPNKGIPGNFPGVSDYSPPPPGIGPGSSRPLAPYTPYTPPSMPPGGRGPLGPPPGPDWFPPPGSGWDRFPPDVRPGGSGPIPPFSNN
ncbi:MAG TPA: RHS repeat-associated core domain-containing protein, partial [Pirellulales bacterium]